MTHSVADSRTIAAIATATGGGIGIVRISGPAAAAIVARVVRPWPASAESHRLYFGRAHAADGRAIDEVLAVLMRAPRSFTGEDVVEIQGHGGRLVMEQLLQAVLAAGAKLATAGEFSRRAVESGRMDLLRAESIVELIGAENDAALAAARAMQSGALGRSVAAARQPIIEALAAIEGVLDFPEDELEEDAVTPATSAADLRAASRTLAALAGSYRAAVFDGAEVLLVGRVNAGKSSLLNALCGEERALVDDQPGTTRDLVSATLRVGQWSINLTDTAGRRSGSDAGALETRGILLGEARLARAALGILVVDGAAGWGALETELWTTLPRRRLIVWNKADLVASPGSSMLPDDLDIAHVIATAAPMGHGLNRLRDAIATALDDGIAPGTLTVNRRQSDALGEAARLVASAADELANGAPAEVAAVAVRRALTALGRVTGETADPEILDALFARFCIGK